MAIEYLAGNRLRGTSTEKGGVVTTTTSDIVWDSSTVHGMSISGNTATTTSTGWTAGVESTDTWTVGDDEISITWTASGAHIATGFGKDPFVITSPNVYNFQEMEYRTYNGSSGTEIYTYDNVGQVGSNHGSWTSSNVMKMTMSTTGVVKYYKDGTLLTTSTNAATVGDTYYVHAGGTNNSGVTNNLEISTISTTTDNVENVVDGSIFYETDTNKSYILYDGSWSEL